MRGNKNVLRQKEKKKYTETESVSSPHNTFLFRHNLMLQLVWRSYAVVSRSTSNPLPPPTNPLFFFHPLSLSHMLRSANKNVFVQISRRGCSSTFQHIFYEGHAVCCRWCCSDGGSAPPPCKKREGKKTKNKKNKQTLPSLGKFSSQTSGLV